MSCTGARLIEPASQFLFLLLQAVDVRSLLNDERAPQIANRHSCLVFALLLSSATDDALVLPQPRHASFNTLAPYDVRIEPHVSAKSRRALPAR